MVCFGFENLAPHPTISAKHCMSYITHNRTVACIRCQIPDLVSGEMDSQGLSKLSKIKSSVREISKAYLTDSKIICFERPLKDTRTQI